MAEDTGQTVGGGPEGEESKNERKAGEESFSASVHKAQSNPQTVQ